MTRHVIPLALLLFGSVPASLQFGATLAGAAFVNATPAQSVMVTYDGPEAPTWTATTTSPWSERTAQFEQAVSVRVTVR